MRARIAIAFLLAISAPLATSPQSSATETCGDSVEVRRGDTLSSIAERCDLNEDQILRANPHIKGSGDLRIGQSLRLAEKGSSTLDRAASALGSAARDGAEVLSGLARELESSATDLLDRNPDLRSRLEKLGKGFGRGSSVPEGATLSVKTSADDGSGSFDLTASGLPPDKEVVIGLGEPRAAYSVLERATTSREGGLTLSVRSPEWARSSGRLVAVVADPSDRWLLRSEPFSLGRP